MHDSTRKIIEYLVDELMNKNINVKLHNLVNSDIGEIAIDLVDASTVVIGTPMVLTGVHPLMAGAIYLVNALRPKTKYLAIVGSYGWGGRFLDEIKEMLKNVKAETFEPVVVKGLIYDADYEKLDNLAKEIIKKNKN
jgi:flavorubredoxin